MARLKTAQPNSSLRKIAVVVATAVSGMSVYAQAAVQPKEETITVTAAPAAQESAWGPAALQDNPPRQPKRTRRFKRCRSLFPLLPPKRWRCISQSRLKKR